MKVSDMKVRVINCADLHIPERYEGQVAEVELTTRNDFRFDTVRVRFSGDTSWWYTYLANIKEVPECE